MIIDFHIHPYCREVTVLPTREEALRRFFGHISDRGAQDKAVAMFSAHFTERGVADIIADMDACGIEQACIVALDMTTRFNTKFVTNEDVGRLHGMYPDRFIPFASVDPKMGRAAVDELHRAASEFGCKGLKLLPPLQGFDFTDPNYFPLWEAAIDLGLVVWTHTSHQMPCSDTDARLGHPMLLEPVAVRYPQLKIVLGHCGFPWHWEAWSLVARHANVCIDISRHFNLYDQFPWEAYLKSGASHKLLFATDYPLLGFKETLNALDQVELPPTVKEKILRDNAISLLEV